MIPSVDEIAAAIDADGVCRVPAIFNHAQVAEMRRAIFEAMVLFGTLRKYHEGGQIQWRESGSAKWPALMFWPALVSKSLRDVRLDPTFLEIIEGLIGPDVRQLNNQWYFRLPGDEDQFNIHADRIFRTEVADEDVLQRRYFQTIIAVDRVSAENGGVEFFLGSHRGDKLDNIAPDRSNLREVDMALRKELSKTYQAKIFDLEPGDMLIWNLGVAHCSMANTSDTPRMTYMNGFCDAGASESWPHYMVGGKAVELTGELIPRRG